MIESSKYSRLSIFTHTYTVTFTDKCILLSKHICSPKQQFTPSTCNNMYLMKHSNNMYLEQKRRIGVICVDTFFFPFLFEDVSKWLGIALHSILSVRCVNNVTTFSYKYLFCKYIMIISLFSFGSEDTSSHDLERIITRRSGH